MEDPNTDMEDADSPASLLRQLRDSPVTASLGPAGPLLRQLRELTTQPEGVSEYELQNLTKDLEGLCISLLDHSEAKEPLSSMAKSWMSEVRELGYDTKNYLDDAPFISKQDDSGGGDDDDDNDAQLTPEEKQEISKLKFKALKDRASHASQDYRIYKPSNRKPKLASTRRRLPVLHPELIDRGRMDKLAALLRKDEEKQLKVVSVVGLEGVGKTTLVKRLYHQIKTGGQFECGAFVRVSPNPDMRRLLTTIFKQIQLPYSVSEGVSQPACCLDAQALITSIKDYLRDKRYFIIIDDLWSTSVWDVIRRAFPDDGCHSRIITTTQFKKVASACCSYQSKYIFEMQPLKYDQSRKLLFSMVFGSEDKVRIPEGIREVPSEIIEKCDGLPLSIINIASLLLTEESEINPKQWMDVRNSLLCTLRRNPTSEGIKEILNLIYNNLSPELKTCLLYLVVHPVGCTVSKGDLVNQWVIEGFIGEGQNKEEIAGWYFDELVSRGMIQAVDINCHGVLSCTLHHTVHNLIVNKSMEENFIISVDYFQSAMGLLDKVRRLSVQLAASRSARIPVGIMMSEVRSLAFFGFYGCVDFIEECKLLRVLILHVWADEDKVPFDLSGIISKLLPLRYVKIACNITVKLPAKIQDLQFLETLEVDTPVVSIPSDIGGLSRLSSLQIAVTELSREDIRILQKLRALTALLLHVCTTPVKMIVFDKEGFLVLKSFKFRCHLPWLKFEEGSMPDLRNLNLCFNAREADHYGIVPIGMEHLSCIEEITADIWGADADVGSTFRTAISNHPNNPRIYMQLVNPIVHGDATTSVGTIKVEDEKKQAASDSRMSKKRMSTLLGSSSQVPVQGVEKKLRLEIETDGIEVKAETFGYGREETAHRMSIQKIKTENIDDKPETKFVIPEGMDIEHCTPSSPMKTESIEDKIQTKFDILEDEKKPADIRMSNSPGSSSRVPDSGADKRSKLKTETDNQTETYFEFFDDWVFEPRMTTSGEFVKLFQWIRSAISSQYSGCREQELQVEVSELEKRLHGLRGTLRKTYNLVDAAEWRTYEHSIDYDDILQNLKVEVYDAEDLLDEFKWYDLKVTVEGNANQCPFSNFFSDFITGSFNEKVQCIQDRLDDLLNQLEKMGLHEDNYESVRRFDKSVRPETNEYVRLRYMHLPLHLKRCFAFCAVYPKDYRFEKRVLAEIWVAEGFVEPLGDIPATDIGCRYFEELVNESFFQEVSGSYIVPHLLHDMAQLVSRNDCFIIREKADFGKVPPDVRHLSILSRKGLDKADLLSLCKHTKLRTLLFDQLWSKDISAVIDHWCSGLHRLRLISCGRTNELPDSIGNLKHLRYLEISRACPFKSLPSAFCYLYSLQIVYAKKCKLETLCGDFSNLISLRRFKSHGFDYSPGCVLKINLVDWEGLGLGFINNVSDVKDLCLVNLGKMSKNQAAEVELKNKQRLNSLELTWGRSAGDRDREVLQALEPPTSLKSLLVREYRGVSLPSWFGPQNLPSLASLTLHRCYGLKSIFLPEGTSLSRVSQRMDDQCKMPVELLVDSNNDTTGIFSSLTDLSISDCPKLCSVEQVIQPAYIPAIKKITIKACESLASAGSFVGFRCLEELVVDGCPDINSQCLVAPSLKRLVLGSFSTGITSPSFGNLADNIDCCSLASFELTCDGLTSIRQQNWTLPALQELRISFCRSLRSIGQSGRFHALNPFVCGGISVSQSLRSIRGRFSSLTSLSISSCEKLSAIDNLLSEEYLPVIQKIKVELCSRLVSLPVEIGSLSSLRSLEITGCPRIRWPRGFVFPSSLQCLELWDSGDMSACVPSCLKNLTSLVSLTLWKCPGITVIPKKVWSGIRKSLQQLRIGECPNLVSIGGARAIRKLRAVTIEKCPKMEDIKQPRNRGSFDYSIHRRHM